MPNLCEIGAHIQPTTGCPVSIFDADRLWLKASSGDASFDGAANEAAYLVAIDVDATWDTEIAKTGLDKLVGTGQINSATFAAAKGSPITAEDGTDIGSTKPSQILTLKLYKPTSEALEAYRQHDGKPVKFFLSLKGNYVLVKKYVSATSDVYFTARNVVVSSIGKDPQNPHMVEIDLYVNVDTFDSFYQLQLANVALESK